MNKRTVTISPSESSNILIVELINTLGVRCRKFHFYNFIDNGDALTKMAGEWVNFGLFPTEYSKGLIEIPA
jgi:hypothetical protein